MITSFMRNFCNQSRKYPIMISKIKQIETVNHYTILLMSGMTFIVKTTVELNI